MQALRDALSEASLKLMDEYNLANLEIEGRLGICCDPETNGGKTFDSNIGVEFFHEIQKMLETCQTWTRPKQTVRTKDFFHKQQGLRLTVDPDTNERKVCIKKNTIAKFDFSLENLPMDLRISFSTELPKSVDLFPKKLDKLFCREKTRTRYTHGAYYFDLTEVCETDDKKIEKLYQYEIEYAKEDDLELLENIASVGSMKIADAEFVLLNITMKLLDANYYCDNDAQFISTDRN